MKTRSPILETINQLEKKCLFALLVILIWGCEIDVNPIPHEERTPPAPTIAAGEEEEQVSPSEQKPTSDDISTEETENDQNTVTSPTETEEDKDLTEENISLEDNSTTEIELDKNTEPGLGEEDGKNLYFSFVRTRSIDPEWQVEFGEDQTRLVSEAIKSEGIPNYEVDLTLDPYAMTIELMEEKMKYYQENLKPTDTFVMYSHSHGYKAGLGVDWDETKEGSAYPWDKLADEILALPAKNVVIFTMSCHSGNLTDAINNKEESWKGKWAAEGRNLVVLTPVAEDQVASPTTTGKEPSEIGNPFTYAVRTALAGEADFSEFGNQDGQTSYGELVDYILDRAKTYSKDQYYRPQFAGEFDAEAIFSNASKELTTVKIPESESNPQLTYTLEVKGGYGTGQYKAGDVVFIKSKASTMNQVHLRWEGDSKSLENPKEWLTKVIMPAHNLTVESIIQTQELNLKASTFKGATELNKTVRYHFPDNMKAVVLINHGTGGSSNFIEKTETFSLALGLVNAGYGVIATEAEEVVAGDLNGDDKIRWNGRITEDNVDFQNLQILFSGMITQGLIPEDTPKFVLGMSAGGSFSHSLGTLSASALASTYPQLKFNAAISYCADASSSGSAKFSLTPSAWFLCGGENNSQVSNEEALQNEEEMRNRGIDTKIEISPITPLYKERFMRISGVTLEQSTGISNEFKAAGFLDESKYFNTDSQTILNYLNTPANDESFPTLHSLGGNQKLGALSQIKVMLGEHSMHSYFIQSNIDFFDKHQ